MAAGDAMVLFAEGTSNDGNCVLAVPLRAAWARQRACDLATKNGASVWVQPLSLAYQGFYGLPMGRAHRPHVAWYGDMELPGHLVGNFYDEARSTSCRHAGESLSLVDKATDRKALTRELEADVRAMTDRLAAAEAGRKQRIRMRSEEPASSSQTTKNPLKLAPEIECRYTAVLLRRRISSRKLAGGRAIACKPPDNARPP